MFQLSIRKTSISMRRQNKNEAKFSDQQFIYREDLSGSENEEKEELNQQESFSYEDNISSEDQRQSNKTSQNLQIMQEQHNSEGQNSYFKNILASLTKQEKKKSSETSQKYSYQNFEKIMTYYLVNNYRTVERALQKCSVKHYEKKLKQKEVQIQQSFEQLSGRFFNYKKLKQKHSVQLLERVLKNNHLHPDISLTKLAQICQIDLPSLKGIVQEIKQTTIHNQIRQALKLYPQYDPKRLRSVVVKKYGDCPDQIHDVIKDVMNYVYICLKPARKKKKMQMQNKKILKMRMNFCNFFKNNNYLAKDIIFCGIKVYSFENLDNHGWVSKHFQGDIVHQYSYVPSKPYQFIVLITISYDRWINYKMIMTNLTQQLVQDHLKNGYVQLMDTRQKKPILILTSSVAEQLYSQRTIRRQLNKGVSKQDISQYRHEKMKKIVGEVGIKKYTNEPSFSERLNPLVGFFQKVESLLNMQSLAKFFLKKIKSIGDISEQVERVVKNFPNNDFKMLYSTLQSYLKIDNLKEEMFKENNWEEIFFEG